MLAGRLQSWASVQLSYAVGVTGPLSIFMEHSVIIADIIPRIFGLRCRVDGMPRLSACAEVFSPETVIGRICLLTAADGHLLIGLILVSGLKNCFLVGT